jgi:hypothetical protein
MASSGSVPYFEKLGERPFTKGVADTGRGGRGALRRTLTCSGTGPEGGRRTEQGGAGEAD